MQLTNNLRGLASQLSLLARPTATIPKTTTSSATMAAPLVRLFSSSPAHQKKKDKKGPSKSPNFDNIKLLRRNMFAQAPPPLRMARLRYLRHWTIHRAWLLFQRQQRQAVEKERNKMHWGMYNACEELRQTAGPGSRSEGYLYRVAMEKKGVWGLDAFPIDYARLQTDSPAKKAWDHEWKRNR